MASQTSTPAKTEKAEAVVKYDGIADVRRITKAEWAKAGVDDQDKVQWDADNEFSVKASELSAGALAVLEKDSAFKLPATEG